MKISSNFHIRLILLQNILQLSSFRCTKQSDFQQIGTTVYPTHLIIDILSRESVTFNESKLLLYIDLLTQPFNAAFSFSNISLILPLYADAEKWKERINTKMRSTPLCILKFGTPTYHHFMVHYSGHFPTSKSKSKNYSSVSVTISNITSMLQNTVSLRKEMQPIRATNVNILLAIDDNWINPDQISSYISYMNFFDAVLIQSLPFFELLTNRTTINFFVPSVIEKLTNRSKLKSAVRIFPRLRNVSALAYPLEMLQALYPITFFPYDSMKDLAAQVARTSPVVEKVLHGVRAGSPFRNFVREHMHEIRRSTARMTFPPVRGPLGPDESTDPEHPRLVAVMIESRPVIEIEYCVRNVMHFLQSEWSLQIHYYDAPTHPLLGNLEYLQTALHQFNNISYVSLPFQIVDKPSYSKLLLSEKFWNGLYAIADKVLIFQTDSVMLRFGINQYLKYGYLGAPWQLDFPFIRQYREKLGLMRQGVGNGGFTLRDVRLMQTILWTKDVLKHNEDLEFSARAEKLLDDFPHRFIAYTFAVESICADIPLAIDFEAAMQHRNIPLDFDAIVSLPEIPMNITDSLLEMTTAKAVQSAHSALTRMANDGYVRKKFVPLAVHQIWVYFQNYSNILNLLRLSLPD